MMMKMTTKMMMIYDGDNDVYDEGDADNDDANDDNDDDDDDYDF